MLIPRNGQGASERPLSDEIRHPKKRAMLAALAKTGNISASARAAGISRCTHYDWLATDPAYRQAVAEAMEDAIDVLEAAARRRALVGSDLLLIFLLKAARPERYRERYQVEHTRDIQRDAQIKEMRESMLELLSDPEICKILDARAVEQGLLPGIPSDSSKET